MQRAYTHFIRASRVAGVRISNLNSIRLEAEETNDARRRRRRCQGEKIVPEGRDVSCVCVLRAPSSFHPGAVKNIQRVTRVCISGEIFFFFSSGSLLWYYVSVERRGGDEYFIFFVVDFR